MLGTGHRELVLRFPNMHHLAGAALSVIHMDKSTEKRVPV